VTAIGWQDIARSIQRLANTSDIAVAKYRPNSCDKGLAILPFSLLFLQPLFQLWFSTPRSLNSAFLEHSFRH